MLITQSESITLRVYLQVIYKTNSSETQFCKWCYIHHIRERYLEYLGGGGGGGRGGLILGTALINNWCNSIIIILRWLP